MIGARRQDLFSPAYPRRPPLTFADLPRGQEWWPLQLTPLSPSQETSAAGWLEVPFDTVPDPVNNYLLNKCPVSLVPMPTRYHGHPMAQMSLRPGPFCPLPQTSSCLSVPLQSPVTPATCGAISPVPCTEPTPSRGPVFSCMRLVWRFLGPPPGRLCPPSGIVGRGDQGIPRF